MKKHLLTTAAMLLGLAALATPAAADVTVRGFIDKDVDIDVIETVRKTKIVTIDVSQEFLRGQSAAEAVGIHNQRTQGNVYNRDCAGCTITSDPLHPPGTGPVGPGGLLATIDSSFMGNTGLVLWNQDVGAFANQANLVTAAVVANADFAEAYNAAAQHTENNQSFVFGFVVAPATPGSPATKSALILDSILDNTGVVMVNQNAGVSSNQYNSLVLAFGVNGAAVALAEADLGQWNINNFTFEVNSIRTSTISSSINNNTGITAVNQNSGNFNNQATMISIAGGLGNTR